MHELWCLHWMRIFLLERTKKNFHRVVEKKFKNNKSLEVYFELLSEQICSPEIKIPVPDLTLFCAPELQVCRSVPKS